MIFLINDCHDKKIRVKKLSTMFMAEKSMEAEQPLACKVEIDPGVR